MCIVLLEIGWNECWVVWLIWLMGGKCCIFGCWFKCCVNEYVWRELIYALCDRDWLWWVECGDLRICYMIVYIYVLKLFWHCESCHSLLWRLTSFGLRTATGWGIGSPSQSGFAGSAPAGRVLITVACGVEGFTFGFGPCDGHFGFLLVWTWNDKTWLYWLLVFRWLIFDCKLLYLLARFDRSAMRFHYVLFTDYILQNFFLSLDFCEFEMDVPFCLGNSKWLYLLLTLVCIIVHSEG